MKNLRYNSNFVSYCCLLSSHISLVRATEKNLEECINGLRQELKYSLELEGNNYMKWLCNFYVRGEVASWLVRIELSVFEPRPGTLCVFSGKTPRSINGYLYI